MFVIHQKKLELKKNNAKNPSQIGLQIIIFPLDPHIWIMYIFLWQLDEHSILYVSYTYIYVDTYSSY